MARALATANRASLRRNCARRFITHEKEKGKKKKRGKSSPLGIIRTDREKITGRIASVILTHDIFVQEYTL
jgi:hypothetical protein